PGALLESPLHDGACVGASVVMQQPGEESARLLNRTRRSVQALRRAGCLVTRITFVLGVQERLKNRLAVARGLLELLADDACILHLVASKQRSEQARSFQLIDLLRSDGRPQHPIHITFREQKFDKNVLKAQPRRPDSPILTALDLTG